MGWDNVNFERQDPITGASGYGEASSSGKGGYWRRDGRSDDREQLKPSFLSIPTERPLLTLFIALVFGILVFGRFLP